MAKAAAEADKSLLSDPDLLFGEAEIAAFLHTHDRTVGKLMKREKMPYRRIGLRPVASRAALRKWIGEGNG